LQEQTLKAAEGVTTLQDQRRELKGRAQNLGEAIARMGRSVTLLQQLAEIELSGESMSSLLSQISLSIWPSRWN